MASISLVSNFQETLQGTGIVSWDMSLSDIASKIKANMPANSHITQVTLNVSGTAYNNGMKIGDEYVLGSLTNGTAGAANNSGAANGEEVYRYGAYEIAYKATVTLPSKPKDITKYFNSRTAEVQNTSYSRLAVSFTSKSPWKKTYTLSVSLDVTYSTHSYTSSVTKQPTCTATGVRTYTCSCGDSYTESIPKISHTELIIPAIEPTCTETGLAEGRYCSVCGETLIAQQIVPAKGHTWIDATCTKPKTCSVCGATEGSALGHDYKSVKTDPTETTNGYATHTCQCGHSYVDSYTCLATFKNYDGSVLRTQTVNQGGIPSAPSNPIRDGYKFIGWSPAVGSIINSTVFTAMYEKLPPEFTSVQMLYQNKQISEDNKVLAEQFFRIVVGVKSYD